MPRQTKPKRPEFRLAPPLLRWYRVHGRKDLPWQHQPTPYRVWVSEIMLQQTQVSTVIPYYGRFMARFPEIRALANAPLDEVLHLWSGLGYYARARNLHRAARILRDEYRGTFPTDFESVTALPGIGRSTAGAILALAYGERYAILDGNVKRVLARLHGIKGWPGEAVVAQKLWVLAQQHTPSQAVAVYTQAIMDMGATLCTRSRPRCDACPVAEDCRAHALGRETDFPAARPRKALPVRRTRLLLITCNGRVLLQRRPPAGLWGGLWGFPEMPLDQNTVDWCREHLHVRAGSSDPWPVLRHTFSHFHLDMQPLRLEVSEPAGIADDADRMWYDPRAPLRVGLAAPVKKLIGQLQNQAGEPRNDTHRQMRLAG